MKRKNNLDEMQEQKLLHIESKGYWLAFWGLGVSLIIQLIFYGPTNDWRYMAAEWIHGYCVIYGSRLYQRRNMGS